MEKSHINVFDKYVNATAMCKAVDKEFKHYNALQTTKNFVEELRGSWIHPQVAIHLG